MERKRKYSAKSKRRRGYLKIPRVVKSAKLACVMRGSTPVDKESGIVISGEDVVSQAAMQDRTGVQNTRPISTKTESGSYMGYIIIKSSQIYRL